MRYITVRGYNRGGTIEFTEIVLPSMRIVCPACESESQVRCDTCLGANVLDVVNEDLCKTKLSWYKGYMRWNYALELENDDLTYEYFDQIL